MSIKKTIETKESGQIPCNEVGRRVVSLRSTLHLSKATFANKIGYSLAHLRRIEIGESIPTQEMIEAIIKVFHLNPKWPFLDDDENLFPDADSVYGEDLSSSAGRRLVQWRKEKGMMQKDLAALAGISLPNLVAVEYGRRKMTLRLAKKVEDACDVSASWLLHGDDLSRDNPCGDKMIEFLRKNPEVRKLVWDLMEKEGD